MSYTLLLWKYFGTVPRCPYWRGGCIAEVTIKRGLTLQGKKLIIPLYKAIVIEHEKQKRVTEEEEEDQSCDGKTVSNEILKGQVQTAKSGRPSQKTEGDGEN